MAVYNTYSDNELLLSLKNADEKAFAELYLRYWDKLFYLAAKKINDFTTAECIIQDVFLDLWNRKESLTIHTAIDAYLVVAVKYRIINEQAKRFRKYEAERKILSSLSEADHSTEQSLAFEELQELLIKKVSQLPEKCRMAFVYRQEGFSYREIAGKMNISEKTVEMHISRALKSLSSSLGLSILLKMIS